MKEKIENKIAEIVDYIVSKPAAEVTLDDYTILTNELIGIRAAETKAESGRRMADLMAMVASPDAPVYGKVN